MNSNELRQIYFTGKADREGGTPLELIVENFQIDGFSGKREPAINKFFAPLIYYSHVPLGLNPNNVPTSSNGTKKVIDLREFFAHKKKNPYILLNFDGNPLYLEISKEPPKLHFFFFFVITNPAFNILIKIGPSISTSEKKKTHRKTKMMLLINNRCQQPLINSH